MLSVHHLFIYDESSALGIAGNALADLTTRHQPFVYGWKLCDRLRNVPNRAKFAEKLEEFFSGRVVANVL